MKRTPFSHILVVTAFLANTFGPVPLAQADEFRLPAPGVMVHLSPPLKPPILKGIKIHPENPFRFDFILDQGDSSVIPSSSSVIPAPLSVIPAKAGIQNQEQTPKGLKQEATKLIKYFLASLTIPEKDLWVNLSPYEKERIIPQSFGLTEMGRDLLAEDYMLKQITASLIYPEDEIGKKFWKRIYEEAGKKFGTTNIPVNTFNKVWIVPEKAVVYENTKAGTAYVVESKLKVMLEQDYLALERNHRQPGDMALAVSPSTLPNELGLNAKAPQGNNRSTNETVNTLGSQIVREIVIPELTKEVNEGKNFTQLRQVYNSLILATWYKKKIKDSILVQVYANKNKIQGLVIPAQAGIQNKNNVEYIYHQYLQAFKKGVYNYIKEELDPLTQDTIPRKYFSGGVQFQFGDGIDSAMRIEPMPKTIGLGWGDNVIQVQTMISPWKFLRRSAGNKANNEHEPEQGLPEAGVTNSFSEEQTLINGVRRTILLGNGEAIVASLGSLDMVVRSKLRHASDDYGRWVNKQILELDALANVKGYVIEQSPLGTGDEHLFVVYRILPPIIVDHTPQGDVRNFVVGQVTQFTDRFLRGNPGWSSLFNNYTVTFHDYYVMHQENIDRILKGELPFRAVNGATTRQARVINRAADITSGLLIKAFAKESRQRRIELQEEANRIHEREHEERRRILNLKEGDTLHSGLEEQLAELRSIMEAREPWHRVAHVLELAAAEREFAWDILSGLSETSDQESTLNWLESILSNPNGLNILKQAARNYYSQIEQQWGAAYKIGTSTPSTVVQGNNSARQILIDELKRIKQEGRMSSNIAIDSYWQEVFTRAGKSELFKTAVSDIQKALEAGLKPFNEGKSLTAGQFAELALAAIDHAMNGGDKQETGDNAQLSPKFNRRDVLKLGMLAWATTASEVLIPKPVNAGFFDDLFPSQKHRPLTEELLKGRPLEGTMIDKYKLPTLRSHAISMNRLKELFPDNWKEVLKVLTYKKVGALKELPEERVFSLNFSLKDQQKSSIKKYFPEFQISIDKINEFLKEAYNKDDIKTLDDLKIVTKMPENFIRIGNVIFKVDEKLINPVTYPEVWKFYEDMAKEISKFLKNDQIITVKFSSLMRTQEKQEGLKNTRFALFAAPATRSVHSQGIDSRGIKMTAVDIVIESATGVTTDHVIELMKEYFKQSHNVDSFRKEYQGNGFVLHASFIFDPNDPEPVKFEPVVSKNQPKSIATTTRNPSTERPIKRTTTFFPWDHAQVSTKKPVGGINLAGSEKVLSVQNNSQGVKFNIDPAQLEQLKNAPGFTPVIINVQPLKDLPAFLGINESNSLPVNS